MYRPGTSGGVLTVAAGLALLTTLFLPARVPTSDLSLTPFSPVPDVVGRSYSAAQKIIEGWTPRQGWSARPEFTPAVAPPNAERIAVVVRQGATFDEPGKTSEDTSYVVVPLTMGVTMPSLLDRSRDDAAALLVRFGLSDVTWDPGDAAADAVVVSQSPVAGSQVAFLDPVVVSFENTIPVPNVVGMGATKARHTLELAGLLMSPDAGSGRVTAQQPPAGKAVTRGSTVTVTLAQVPGLTVPNLLGLTFGQARQAVDQSGLRLDAPPGVPERRRVTGQRPPAGTPAHRGDIVSLTFAAEPAKVPNLIGLEVGKAREVLDQAGLRLDARADEGSVIGQQPRAGTPVAAGSTVSVTLRVLPGLRVPNILGLTVEQARTSLARLGLRLAAPDSGGRIREQDPPADTPAVKGDTIAVTLIAATGGGIDWKRGLLVAGSLGGLLLAAGSGAQYARTRPRHRWVRKHAQVRAQRSSVPTPRPQPPSEPALRVGVHTRIGPGRGRE